MSTPGSKKTAIWRDLILVVVLGTLIFAVVAALAGGRPASIATGAFCILALMVLAARHDARETAAEHASRDEQPRGEDEPREAPLDSRSTIVEEPAEDTAVGEQPLTSDPARNGQDGRDREEEAADQQGVVATQTISPALYGTGVVDEVTGQIGQVNLLETGLNVLAKVDGSGTIDEANEGMEVVTGVPRDELLGTDAFSYFIEPTKAKNWFMEALQGSSVRDKEVEVLHQEGETTPLTYNVIATIASGRNGGVLLCRYRED